MSTNLIKGIVGVLLFSMVSVRAFAQCPTMQTTANGGNGSTPLVICNGTAVHLQSVGNLPAGSSINWYEDSAPAYTPPAQGTLIGNTSNTVGVNCPAVCPSIVAIFINACNGSGAEPDNEYIVFASGSGFAVNDLKVDLSNSAATGQDADINYGPGTCGYQTPTAAFITALRTAAGCTTIYAAGPGSVVPAGAAVVLFTSRNVTANYNFTALCSSTQAIYVMQSNCQRTGGAFTNAPYCGGIVANRLKTTSISINNCATCNDSLTYSRCGLANNDGEYAIPVAGSDTSSVANGGVLIDNVNPCNGPNFLTVPVPPDTLRLTYTPPSSFCNQTIYLRGVLTPAVAGCPTDVLTQIFPVHIVCPTPAIAGLHTVCSNASNPLTVNDGTGGTFPTIKWTTPTATNLTAASVSALQSGTYTATVTGATGCTASTSFAVVVNAAPLPTLTGNDFFCTQNAPLSTTLTVSAAFSSYNWSGTPVNTTNSLTANTAGNYTVTVIDANGCTGVTTKTVRASTITNLAITGNTSFCAGSSTTLICVVGTPNVNFIWNTLNTGTSTTASAAGNYCVTATNADGCSTSTCQTVSSIALPTPTISGGNHLLCANSTTNTLSVSGGVFSLVKWERPDHSLLTATTLPAALQNGIYTVTVTGTGGCTATATFDVTVDIVPTISLTSSLSSICAGGTAVLTASGASTFTWSQGGNTPTVSVSPTITTIYTVTATNNGICSTTKSITVTVNAAPGSITFEPTLLCVNGAANIGIIPESANNTYTWSTGETGLSITIAAAGIYTATVTNVNGCTNTGSIPMVTVVPPVSYAGRDTTIELGQSVQLFGQVISSPYPNVEYHWEANHGTVATYSQNPLVTPTETTIYTFHIHTVPGECESDETELTVTVLKRLGCLSPDEGFTPNGDGKNDTWTIPCLQDEPNFMEIYNRWGESIFKATNYYNTFDGKLNGQLLPDGTYYYVVKAQSRNFKGTVTILR